MSGDADRRLKRPGVAEIDAGQQRRVVQSEDAERRRGRAARTSRAHRQRSATARLRGDRPRAPRRRGRVFSTCRGSTHPRRAVVTPSSICLSSMSARWQSLSIDDGRRRPRPRAGRARRRVEVRRRAVDFQRRVPVSTAARRAGRSRDRSRAGAARAGCVGCVIIADQRMLHRGPVALQQLLAANDRHARAATPGRCRDAPARDRGNRGGRRARCPLRSRAGSRCRHNARAAPRSPRAWRATPSTVRLREAADVGE